MESSQDYAGLVNGVRKQDIHRLLNIVFFDPKKPGPSRSNGRLSRCLNVAIVAKLDSTHFWQWSTFKMSSKRTLKCIRINKTVRNSTKFNRVPNRSFLWAENVDALNWGLISKNMRKYSRRSFSPCRKAFAYYSRGLARAFSN
jgi:hypothetical protein